MRSFQTSDASWYFCGPDRSRDAAEQLGQDLWVLSDPNLVPSLVANVASRVARAVTDAGAVGLDPARLVACVLDSVHEVAGLGSAQNGLATVGPEVGALCRCISDAFAECASVESALAYLHRLTGVLDTLSLQVCGDPQLLALTSSVAVAVDAPFPDLPVGFFELHDAALRRLFTRDTCEEGFRSHVDTLFDAQLDLARARAASSQGSSQGARSRLEAAKAAFLALGLRIEAADCDRRLAQEARLAGELDTAWAQLTAARATLGEFGAVRETALCHLQAGLLLLDRDDPARALTEAETALGVFSDLHAWYELELSAEICSRAAERLGDLARALAMARFAHMLCDSRTPEGQAVKGS
ncbi:MAG: hypothetical protein IT198_13065 [Acidimicrobiia bacterium]|nr:hypothetical protein [Acidimicrobiia bacterium]